MWHQSLGLQLLGFLTLILGVLLAAYAIYVRVKQTTYTEKRFSFYAFLACSMLAATMLFVLFNVSPWEPVFRYVGLPIEPTSFSDKALGVVLVLCFTALSSHWARSWNGQLTQSGGEARLRGEHTSFLSDGMEEIFRIVRRIPPESIFKANRKSFEGVRLAPPLVDLPFHEQVLDLARAAWPDLIVEANAWGAEAKSWRGILATLDQPFLVVCCVDKSEWNLSRVREQWLFEGAGDRQPRIVVVIDRLEDCELITQELRDVIPEAEVISFDALVSRALPLAQYRREIARQFAEQDLPNASFAAKEIFAAVSIRSLNMITAGRISEDEVCEEFEDHIANWIGHVGNRQLALLGDYGQGKSTAVLALTYRMLFDEAFAKSTGGRLPILIRLTGQSPKTSSPEELLSAWGGALGLMGEHCSLCIALVGLF
ncbi:hypothetical protein [Reyranella sp.]|uniref:hypothetical protein n=1 Tax=Reyranella sp. TaxID=1929291 RepID=UPI003F702507